MSRRKLGVTSMSPDVLHATVTHSAWARRPKTRQAMLRAMCRRLVIQGAQPVREFQCLWTFQVARGVARDAQSDGLIWVVERRDGLWAVPRGAGRVLGKLALEEGKGRHR